MNKIIILILCLCCAFTIARAEEGPALNPSDANIVGHVVDRKTGEHLSFITIFLKGTTIGTSTDGTGHYYLKNLPEGEFTVVMKTMGYKTIETPVMLKKGRTLEINFEVEEEALSLDGVVVSANRNETTRRMAPSLVNVLDSQCTDGCVRPRTDSGQYDRACRDHAWWRFRSFWFFGDCRYDQYHYKRAFAQLSPDCPFADDDRRKSPGQ